MIQASSDAVPTKRVLWKWSAILTGLLLIFMMWRCGSALFYGRRLADVAVRRFHQRLNAADYENIYREADEGFRRGQTHDDSIKFLEIVHNKLGSAGQETQLNIRVDTNVRGSFVTTQYNTVFATGTVTEMFIWARHGNSLKLYAYRVQSNTLIPEKSGGQNAKAVD